MEKLKNKLIDAIFTHRDSLVHLPVREHTIFDRTLLLDIAIHSNQKSINKHEKERDALKGSLKHLDSEKFAHEIKNREELCNNFIKASNEAQFVKVMPLEIKKIMHIKTDLEKEEEQNKIQEEKKQKKEKQMKEKENNEKSKKITSYKNTDHDTKNKK